MMGQLFSTILVIMVLLLVPLGVVQIHVVMQMKSELLDLSVTAAKFVSNHGGTSDSQVMASLRSYLKQELANKTYRINPDDVQVQIIRTKAAEPNVWSHEDEFKLVIGIPYPRITTLFPSWERPLTTERTGTINVMDYDL